MALDFWKTGMCSPSLTIFSITGSYPRRIKVLTLDNQPYLQLRRWGKSVLFPSRLFQSILSALRGAYEASLLWSYPPYFSLMILSALRKVSASFSSQLLFVPLSGAGCLQRWCCECFRFCTERGVHGEKWLFPSIMRTWNVVLLSVLGLFPAYQRLSSIALCGQFLQRR